MRVAKNLQDLGGSFEENNDLDLRDDDFFDKFWGKQEPYSSNTEDESKYKTKKNKDLAFMKRTFRIRHILRLWKLAYNKVSGITMIIHHVNKIQTKLKYFGGQLLSRNHKDYLNEREQYRKNTIEKSKFLISPDSNVKKFWDLIMIVLLLYTATYVPYRITFLEVEENYGWLETTIDVLFGMDIFINFLTPYEKFNGTYQYSLKKIARNYIFGAFFIDVIATVPTHLFVNVDVEDDGNGQNKLLRLARLQRLYKLFRIFRIIKLIKITKYQGLLYKLVAKFEISSSMTRVLIVNISALFLVHLFSCFFFLSAKMNDFADNTWVAQKGILGESEFFKYCLCLYWAF